MSEESMGSAIRSFRLPFGIAAVGLPNRLAFGSSIRLTSSSTKVCAMGAFSINSEGIK
jgi:hypothetical protein